MAVGFVAVAATTPAANIPLPATAGSRAGRQRPANASVGTTTAIAPPTTKITAVSGSKTSQLSKLRAQFGQVAAPSIRRPVGGGGDC